MGPSSSRIMESGFHGNEEANMGPRLRRWRHFGVSTICAFGGMMSWSETPDVAHAQLPDRSAVCCGLLTMTIRMISCSADVVVYTTNPAVDCHGLWYLGTYVSSSLPTNGGRRRPEVEESNQSGQWWFAKMSSILADFVKAPMTSAKPTLTLRLRRPKGKNYVQKRAKQ